MKRGAAIAQVSGEVDRIFSGVAPLRRSMTGAEAGSVQTLDEEDIPIAYLPGNARRVRVRVFGEVARLTAGGASF